MWLLYSSISLSIPTTRFCTVYIGGFFCTEIRVKFIYTFILFNVFFSLRWNYGSAVEKRSLYKSSAGRNYCNENCRNENCRNGRLWFRRVRNQLRLLLHSNCHIESSTNSKYYSHYLKIFNVCLYLWCYIELKLENIPIWQNYYLLKCVTQQKTNCRK